MRNCSLKKGFTLAEVLITLAIVGVVAAMTIPTLLNKYQAKIYETRMKDAVSILKQANQLVVLQGFSPYKDFDISNSNGQSSVILNNAVEQYSKVLKAKICLSSDKSCKISYKNLTGKRSSSLPIYSTRFLVLPNNYAIFWGSYSPHYIFIDINGINEAPNRLGIDLQTFKINKNNVIEPIKENDHDARICTYSQPESQDGYLGTGCSVWAIQNRNPDGDGSYWGDFVSNIK